jgi:hypothetical protein
LNETRKLPDSARRELTLLLKLNPALSILKSPQSREFEDFSRRAHEIAQGLGDGPELFKATWHLWFSDNMGRRSVAALARAEELVALGERLRDEDLLLEAIHCRWSTAFFHGDHAVAFNDSREGVRRYDPARHHRLGAAFGGHDPGVCAHAVHGVTLALSGRFDAARVSVEAAVGFAERLGQPHSLAHAHFEAALASQIAGDRVAMDHASRRWSTSLSGTNSRHSTRRAGFSLLGRVRSDRTSQSASTSWRPNSPARRPSVRCRTIFATLLADIRVQSGRVAEAYQLIEQILAAVIVRMWASICRSCYVCGRTV